MMHPSAIARTETILQREISNNSSPMLQYRYFKQDEILYRFDAGFANLQTRIKADSNTTFNAFSLTKTITAVAILQLAEQQLLHVDDAVNKYLPGVLVWPEVSIRQLLSHTAGIGNPIPLKWIHTTEEHAGFNYPLFYKSILREKTLRKIKPGKKIAYSNIGYVLAGLIIESVTGLSYEQYVTEHIIQRSGIESAQLSFTIPQPLLHASGYHNRYSMLWWILGLLFDKKKYMGRPVGKWVPFTPNYVNGMAYGGLIGSADAFVAFGQALLKQESQLLSAPYKELLFEEQLLSSGKKTGMSLGWFVGECGGRKYRAHPGGGGGYYCELRLYADSGSFVVFNRSGFSNEKWLDGVDIGF